MAFRHTHSILETGTNLADAVNEADVIFTAAFIGMTLFQNRTRNRPMWRVDMEPNNDGGTQHAARTMDDRQSMKKLNDACSKVNAIVHALNNGQGGVHWGFTPTFQRGGMICAGHAASVEYAQVDPRYAKLAYAYLSAPRRRPENDQRADEMYIGRGAYCGIVIDENGNAINAMSTIRWSLRETTPGIGDRWLPPVGSPAFATQQRGNGALWGMITPPGKDSQAAAEELRQLGMRFFSDGNPSPDTHITAYTHGMIRCIYETARIGRGTAFEISIGTDTFKLASCMSCSSFMMANGVDASSSHLGRGESWSPYFIYNDHSHNYSYVADEQQRPLQQAIDQCNAAYAKHMYHWMHDGAEAMHANRAWVKASHHAALDALRERLQIANENNTVARDLYLDAMTLHKSDTARLDSALAFAPGATAPYDGTFDWNRMQQTGGAVLGIWETFENPFTDEEVNALHTLYSRIKIWSVHANDSCALEYAIKDPQGAIVQRGRAAQENGVGMIDLPLALVESGDAAGWKIKFDIDRDFAPLHLTGAVAIGSGSRYSYAVLK